MKRVDSSVEKRRAISSASLMATIGRDVDAPEELPDPGPQDVPVHDRHPIELPVLGEAADQLVDLGLVRLDAADQRVREARARRRAPRWRCQKASITGPGSRLAPDVQLVEELERELASLAPASHPA